MLKNENFVYKVWGYFQILFWGKSCFQSESTLQVILRALKSKVYALDVEGEIKKRNKRIQSAALRKIKFEYYYSCLFHGRIKQSTTRSISRKKHKISTIETRKSSLTPYDDKRYISKDGIRTFAHGHHRINRIKSMQN